MSAPTRRHPRSAEASGAEEARGAALTRGPPGRRLGEGPALIRSQQRVQHLLVGGSQACWRRPGVPTGCRASTADGKQVIRQRAGVVSPRMLVWPRNDSGAEETQELSTAPDETGHQRRREHHSRQQPVRVLTVAVQGAPAAPAPKPMARRPRHDAQRTQPRVTRTTILDRLKPSRSRHSAWHRVGRPGRRMQRPQDPGRPNFD